MNLISPVLSCNNLVHNFGALRATDNVSLSLFPGEVHGLIGPNGAGKSTLIQLLAGGLFPAAGSLTLLGEDITRLAPHERVARGLARSFQVTNIFKNLTVNDNLLFAVQAAAGSSFRFWVPRNAQADLLEQAMALARQCGITLETLNKTAGLLAHGEQRKLEFALALASEPEVLLLDEPMAGMGPDETPRLAALIEQLKGQYAILLVEHDMQTVFSLADRISVLDAGKIIASGTPNDIRDDPAVITAYLGTDTDLLASWAA